MAVTTISMTETQIDMMDYSSGDDSSTTAGSDGETDRSTNGRAELGSISGTDYQSSGHVCLPTHPAESSSPRNASTTKSPPALVPNFSVTDDQSSGHVCLPTHPAESSSPHNASTTKSPVPKDESMDDLPSHGAEYDKDDGDSISAPAWSYREQFKQLYTVSDEPDRKEFLDKLFAFMQQKNSPISRIPIMAKQPLDLYKLSKLVIERGGLLEVIRRKAWREIAKALDLPASITSAAFTLRTQYLKYLYPFECAMEKLSQPQEIKDAIEGNKRDRRISSDIDLNEFTTSPPTSNNRHSMEGAVLIRSLENPLVTPTFSTGTVQLVSSQINALSPSVSAYSIISGPQGTYIPTPHMTVGPHGTPIPLVVTPTPMVRPVISTSASSPPHFAKSYEERMVSLKRPPSTSSSESLSPAEKKPIPSFFEIRKPSGASMPYTDIRIRPNRPSTSTSAHGMGVNMNNMTESSILVSIDVNGTQYQGVLFAKPSNNGSHCNNIGHKN